MPYRHRRTRLDAQTVLVTVMGVAVSLLIVAVLFLIGDGWTD